MKIIWAVAWREYRIRVTSPMYLILTALSFLLLVGGPVVGALLFGADALKPVEVRVIDQTGWALPQLKDALDGESSEAAAVVLRTEEPTQQAALLAQAREGKIPGLLVLEGNAPDQFKATFSTSSNITLTRAQQAFAPALRQVLLAERLRAHQVDPALAELIQQPVQSEFVQLTTGEEAKGYAVRTLIATVFNLLMYVAIVAYAQLTFQGVLEEKASRVMEVLVAAVKPEHLMAGKVLGIGLVGLTQMATWALAYVVLLGVPVAAVTDAVSKIDASIFAYMAVYFLLGFFLYAALYAALASTISRMEDSAALMTPVQVVVMASYFVAVFAAQNPTSAVATVFSLIPFFAPVVMVVRLALSQPPFWQVALSLIGLAVTMLLMVWAAARIYRVGVLMYGARPTWRLIWRYFRSALS